MSSTIALHRKEESAGPSTPIVFTNDATHDEFVSMLREQFKDIRLKKVFDIKHDMSKYKRTWIITPDLTLLDELVIRKEIYGKRVCVIDKHLEIVPDYDDPTNLFHNEYRDILYRKPIIGNSDLFPIVAATSLPQKWCTNINIQGDMVIPVMSSKVVEPWMPVVENALQMRSAGEFIDCTVAGSWDFYKFMTCREDLLPVTNRVLTTIGDREFEACSGSEDLVAEISNLCTRSHKRRMDKIKDRYKVPASVLKDKEKVRVKKELKKAQKSVKEQTFAKSIGPIESYEDIYAKLTKLAARTTIAESCSGAYEDFQVGKAESCSAASDQWDLLMKHAWRGKDEIHKCVSLVEQIGLLLFTCKQSQNLAGIASAIAMWLLTRYGDNKSILMEGYRIFTEFLGRVNVNMYNMAQDEEARKQAESSEPVDINDFGVDETKENEPCAGVEFEELGEALQSAKFLGYSETMVRLQDFLKDITSLGCTTIFGFQIVPTGVMDGFNKMMYCTKFYDSIVGHLTYFTERLWAAYDEGNPYALLGSDTTCDLMLKVQDLAHIVTSLGASTTPADPVTLAKIEFDIDECLKRLVRDVVRATGHAKVQFLKSRQVCLDLKIELGRIRESGQNRVPAFGIILHGVTGQGKSALTDAIISGLCAEHHGEISDALYQTMIGSHKWDQCLAGYRAIVLEELASGNPNKMTESPSIDRIMRFINPANTPAMEAVADKKGKLLPHHSIVLGTTNVKDFQASIWMSYKAAAMRRFKVYVKVRAKDEHREKGVLSLDKTPEGVAPWLLSLEYVDVTYDEKYLSAPHPTHDSGAFNDATKVAFKPIMFEGRPMTDVTFNEAYLCISSMYGKHIQQETDLSVVTSLIREMGICEHKVPYTFCENAVCVAKKEEKKLVGRKKATEHQKIFAAKMKVFDTKSFNKRFNRAQATAGEVRVRGFFNAPPTLEAVNRAIRRCGLENLHYDDIEVVCRCWEGVVTKEVFAIAKMMQKWHVINAGEQVEKYFDMSINDQDDLRNNWLSLKHTPFCGIRAPYRLGQHAKGCYELSTGEYRNITFNADIAHFEEAKKAYEVEKACTGFMDWKKRNKLLAPFVDIWLNKMGFNITRNSSFLNALASMFDGIVGNTSPMVLVGVFLLSTFIMPWNLIFIIPLAVVTFVLVVIQHAMEKCKVFWDAFDPANAVKVATAKAKLYVKTRYVHVGAAIVGALVVAKFAYTLYASEENKKKPQSCGSATSQPKEIMPGFRDIYQRPVIHTIKEYTNMGPNNTKEQAMAMLDNSLYVIRMSVPGMTLEDPGVSFSNCILTGMFALVNRHSFIGLEKDQKAQMQIQIFKSKNMQPHCKCYIVYNDLEFFGDDYVAVRLRTIVPTFDLFKEKNSLFPEVKVDIPLHCTWMWRNPEGELETEIVRAIPSKVEYEDRRTGDVYKYNGYSYDIALAKKGQCMAVLISNSSPCVVIGVHTAGRVGMRAALAGRISRSEVVEAMRRQDAKSVMCSASVGDIDVDPFRTGDYILRPISYDACVNQIPVELGVSNAQVYGQIPGLVNQRVKVEKVKYTRIGEKFEKIHPEYKVAVPINLNARGFVQNLQKCAVQTDTGNREALEYAKNSLFKFYSDGIDKQDAIGDTNFERDVHPIRIEDVFNGSVAGYNTVDLTKSAGYGFKGKKRGLMEEPIEFEDFPEYVVPKPILKEQVEKMFETCKAKIIPSSIHTGALKRELLPEAKATVPKPFVIVPEGTECGEGEITYKDLLKKKVRFFAGCSFPFLICCKMMFGMLLRYFTLYNVVFGMALGLNLHCYDYTVLVESWAVHGSAIIAGDYEKFDKKLNSLVTSTSAEVLLMLLAKAGYSREQLDICSCLLYDVIFPLYLWSGVLLRLAQTTPSGHPLTLVKNNLDNQICLRYCWARLFMDTGIEIPDFDMFVVINTVGDDHIGTVSPLYPQYNLHTIAKYMLEIGMVYTAADKSALVNVYESFDKIEYLKTRAVWNDELGVYMPLLNKASIYKMVMKTLAPFSENSVEMEEHTLEVLKEAFHCMFYYGREEFEKFSYEVASCVDEKTFPNVLFNLPSYSQELDDYKTRLIESNTVRLDTNFVVPEAWR